MAENEKATSVPTPESAMVIFAHPDDCEFIAAGTVAKWAAEGCRVIYVSCTSGDKGTSDQEFDPQKLIETREQEQRDAAAAAGVEEVEFLRYMDATLVADLELRKELTRMIRKHQPEALICPDPTARWVGQEYIQHPDHIAVGEASLAAVFPSARDHLTFRDLLDEEELEPHKVTHVLLSGAKEPDMWIDISEVIEKKIAALKAHKSQVEDWDPSDMLREWASGTADEARKQNFPDAENIKMAEAFKYFKLD